MKKSITTLLIAMGISISSHATLDPIQLAKNEILFQRCAVLNAMLRRTDRYSPHLLIDMLHAVKAQGASDFQLSALKMKYQLAELNHHLDFTIDSYHTKRDILEEFQESDLEGMEREIMEVCKSKE